MPAPKTARRRVDCRVELGILARLRRGGMMVAGKRLVGGGGGGGGDVGGGRDMSETRRDLGFVWGGTRRARR